MKKSVLKQFYHMVHTFECFHCTLRISFLLLTIVRILYLDTCVNLTDSFLYFLNLTTSLCRQVVAINHLANKGMYFWDYGNAFLLEAGRAGQNKFLYFVVVY